MPDSERRKLDKKAKRLRFVGYSKNPKGYRLFDEETCKVTTKRDVLFNETCFDVATTDVCNKPSANKEEMISIVPETNETQTDEEVSDDQPQEEPCRSQRQRRQPIWYGFTEYADTAVVDHIACNVCEVVESRTIEEALAGDQAKEWKAAAEAEYQLLIDNET